MGLGLHATLHRIVFEPLRAEGRCSHLVLSALMIWAATIAAAAERQPEQSPSLPGWRGERQVRDGVTYVHNPPTPLESDAFFEMVEVWRLRSDNDQNELVFGAISDVELGPDGSFFLADYVLSTVHVVDEHGQVVGRIGRQGEGPGELRSVDDCFILSDRRLGIVEFQAQTITIFDFAGAFLTSWKAEGFGQFRVRPFRAEQVGRSLLVSFRILRPSDNTATLERSLALFAPSGHLQKLLAERTLRLTRGQPMVFDEAEMERFVYFAISPTDHFYVAPSYDKYEIHRYSSSGELTHVISRQYEHLKRTRHQLTDTRELLASEYSAYPDADVTVQAISRDIMALSVHDDRLWVETSRGWLDPPAGTALVIDELNLEGRFLRRIHLHGTIDNWHDYMFLRGPFAIRVTSAIGSYRSASASPDLDVNLAENEEIPMIICYRLCPL